MADIRQVVRAALDRAGINQRELARRMGATEGWISQLLAFDANPTVETLEAIATACGLRLHIRMCHCSEGGGFVCTPCKEELQGDAEPRTPSTHPSPGRPGREE